MAVDGQLETQNRAGSPCTRLLLSLQTSAFSAAMGICDMEKSSQNCRYQKVGKSQWVEMNSGCPIQQIPGRQRLQTPQGWAEDQQQWSAVMGPCW